MDVFAQIFEGRKSGRYIAPRFSSQKFVQKKSIFEFFRKLEKVAKIVRFSIKKRPNFRDFQNLKFSKISEISDFEKIADFRQKP